MNDAERIGLPNVGDTGRFANREMQKNRIFLQNRPARVEKRRFPGVICLGLLPFQTITQGF